VVGMEEPGPVSISHPVLTCAGVIGGALDEVAGIDPVLMSPAAKAAAMVELSRVIGRTQGLLMRVVASADDVALEEGSRSTAAWLAHHTRTTTSAAATSGRLAEALEGRWHQVAAAVGAGAVNVEQARAITQALDELPDDLDPDLLVKAEAHLVTEAGFFDATRLRVLGRKVLEVVAPQVAEDHERRRLEEDERRARETTRLSIRRRGDGTSDIRARVADAVAGRLRTCLEAFGSPRRGHLAAGIDPIDPDTGKRLPHEVLLGRAFGALLEALPTRVLPLHGGSPTTVVVTIGYDQLLTKLGSANLDTGDVISASEAMRLACQADLVPMVLGGPGRPLHLGRARRLFDKRQRLAMAVRDGHCRAVGCDIPAAWCEAHHKTHWCRGGRTDLDDGVLLCGWHHHRAHDCDYRTKYLPNGDVRFARRT
jgi:uncharacterized protein DUF222